MSNRYKAVVLITGCSQGLGLALARVFAASGLFRLIATARQSSIHKLKSVLCESENVRIRELDVTCEESRHKVVCECYHDWKSLDVLINNAGVSYRSVVEHMDEDAEIHQLNTNYLGPMALTRLVLPSMREKGRGKIINISSVSGMMAMPTMASYSASKHALEGATEALWYELKPFGINVSLVQPGFIQSESYKNVYYSKKAQLSGALEGPYADFYKNISPFIERTMNRSGTTPEKIAQKVLKIVTTREPPLWVSVTRDSLFFFLLRKIIPRSVFHSVMNALLPNSRYWGARFTRAKKDLLQGQAIAEAADRLDRHG